MSVEQPAPQGHRPLVVAHRGASFEEPEHTLAAYRRAFANGADGVECDVRLTADFHLVCVHDRRVNRTSNGAGFVSALELARLEELDWASWKARGHHGETPESDPERGRLLTLRRLLDTLIEQKQEIVTLIETKHPTRHGAEVERTLVQALRFFELDTGDQPGRPQVRVMSFSRRALSRVHRLAPKVPLIQLVEPAVPSIALDGTLSTGVTRVGLHTRMLHRPKVISAYHRMGHEVCIYTVDEPDDVKRCVDLGVDVIITNRPRAVIDQLAGSG
ncbi:MAG: glycerophosphodiester phosphodiesterase family protein [Ornithinibacter sp.]